MEWNVMMHGEIYGHGAMASLFVLHHDDHEYMAIVTFIMNR